MTVPVQNDGTWNMYQEIVEQSEELEKDLRSLHNIIARAGISTKRCMIGTVTCPGGSYSTLQYPWLVGNPRYC